MAPDPITQKHLDRLRIRGAPATIPGAAGLVGAYDAEETWRQTCRALVLPLPKHFTAHDLRDAFTKLREHAEAKKLTVTEDPLFALKGDPSTDPPHTWTYEAVLPVRGAAKPDGDITVTRVEGGMHIASITGRGLADLRNLYVFLFGKFLPSKKQQIMRPYILHLVVPSGSASAGPGLDGLEKGDGDKLVIATYVPAVLSIKPVPVPGEESESA